MSVGKGAGNSHHILINTIEERIMMRRSGRYLYAYLVMMASTKVKAGTRSDMAEAKVGELYLIPTYINICIEQLHRTTRTKTSTVSLIQTQEKVIWHFGYRKQEKLPDEAKNKDSAEDGRGEWRRGFSSADSRERDA